jgi:hypothetical protein
MKGYREGGEAWEDRMFTWNAVKGSPGSRKQRGGQNQRRSAAAVVDVADDASPTGPPGSIFLDEEVHSSEAKLWEALSWREVY